MNGDISNNTDVALAKAQAVEVAAKNRQTPIPMPTGMPSQTSLLNNAMRNQTTMPMSSQPTAMPQRSMMPQQMLPNQTPPIPTHNIGKSPQNSGNLSQSPHMSPQAATPRQSPGPAITNKPAAAHSQMQNPQTPNTATPNAQPTSSQAPGAQTPGAQTPPKVSHNSV